MLQFDGTTIRRAEGPALLAANAHIGSHLRARSTVSDGRFSITGMLSLAGASIAGDLDLRGALLSCPDGAALDAGRSIVKGSVYCHSFDTGPAFLDFRADGGLSFWGAIVEGNFSLSGAQIAAGKAIYALAAMQMEIKGSVFGFALADSTGTLRPMTIDGSINFTHTRIDGGMMMSGAQISAEGDSALIGFGLQIGKDLLLNGVEAENGVFTPFCAVGSIELNRALIADAIHLGGAQLTNSAGVALHARHIRVGAGMLARPWICADGSAHRFKASGTVDIAFAQVHGGIDLSGADLECVHDLALRAHNSRIEGSLFAGVASRAGIGMEFSARGGIGLAGAVITGDLDLDGATIINDDGYALECHLAQIGRLKCGPGYDEKSKILRTPQGDLALRFHCEGGMFLNDTVIRQGVRLGGAQIRSVSDLPAISAQRTVINGDLDCSPIRDGDGPATPFAFSGRFLLHDAQISGTVRISDVEAASDSGAVIDLTGAAMATLDHDRGSVSLILNSTVYSAIEPPQNARERVRWLGGLAGDYDPRSYEQLAGHYRKLGSDHEARLVLYRKNVAQRALMPRWRRPVDRLLGTLSGYGYLPLRALFWLVGAIALGSTLTWLHRPQGLTDSRVVLYVIDVIIPTSPFGLESKIDPTGLMYWFVLALQILGWGLSLALIPALTRSFSRT